MTRGDISATTPLIAEALAAQAAGALASRREIEDLQRALVTRSTTRTAVGLLMARHQLNETAALAVLERRASQAGVPLHEVAQDLVDEADAVGCELPGQAIC
jgi:AmiR/NasT family two-component response regulator